MRSALSFPTFRNPSERGIILIAEYTLIRAGAFKSSPLDAGAMELVTESAAMKRVAELIERVAATEANVLVLGESGTGKDLVARQIHDRSPRRGSPYVSIDCASLPEELLES